MSLLFGLKVLAEVAVVLLICYGIWNEEKLIEFEDVLFWCIKNPGKASSNISKYIKGRNKI